MSHQPDNVFAGTQVVSLVEVRGTNNSLDPKAVAKIEAALEEIEEVINDLSEEEGDSESSGDSEWRSGTAFGSSERAIFDDVDE